MWPCECTITKGFLLVSILWCHRQIGTLVSIPETFYLLQVNQKWTLKLLFLFASELELLTEFKLTNICWDRYVTHLYSCLFKTHFSHYCQFNFSVQSDWTILFKFSLRSVFYYLFVFTRWFYLKGAPNINDCNSVVVSVFK